jgi:hypothetical protein
MYVIIEVELGACGWLVGCFFFFLCGGEGGGVVRLSHHIQVLLRYTYWLILFVGMAIKSINL